MKKEEFENKLEINEKNKLYWDIVVGCKEVCAIYFSSEDVKESKAIITAMVESFNKNPGGKYWYFDGKRIIF